MERRLQFRLSDLPWYPKRIRYVAPYTTRYAILHGRVGIRWYSSTRNDAHDRAGAPRPSRHRVHHRRVRPTTAAFPVVPSLRHPRTSMFTSSETGRTGWPTSCSSSLRSDWDGTSRAAGAQFDIAHIHGHRHLLEVVAARWCRRHGVPYVSAPNGTAPRIERRQALKRVWDAMWGQRDLAARGGGAGGQPGRACAAAGDGRRAAADPGRAQPAGPRRVRRRRRLEAASGGSTISATGRWSCFWARSRRASGSTW